MKTIAKMNTDASMILGVQQFSAKKKYRLLKFCYLLDLKNQSLLFNNLTKELLLLTDKETEKIKNRSVMPEDFTKLLVNKWFLVPIDNDDISLCDNLRDVVKLLRRKDIKDRFTVMTTTDCNARCFYCYEMGRKRVSMTSDTANAVAEYMMNSSKNNKISISWFGGEPLYNSKVIDIICNVLVKNNVEFNSTMATNGYLFTPEMVEKAVNLWNLKKVQISLDGTEKIYNKYKSYIHSDENPFLTVINNIKLLLLKNIRVSIRLNIGNHNIDDLYKLCEYLAEKFSSFSNFSVYGRLLFQEEKKVTYTYLSQALIDLHEYIRTKNINSKDSLNSDISTNRCMADDDRYVMIAPDGSLGKCEHFSESHFFGNINTPVYDVDEIERWKEKYPISTACNSCALYPTCLRLKNCPDIKEECDINERTIKEYYLKMKLLNMYQNATDT